MIAFRTLGAVDLKASDGHTLQSVLAQPKRLALFTYLLIAAPRAFHRRDTLLALFWPESDQGHARNSLSQALHFLRRSVGEDVLLTRGTEEIGLNTEAIWCDALAFEDALGAGECQRALELYRGDLLEGFHIPDAPEFERWLETERAHIKAQALSAALRLSKDKEAVGDLTESLQWARYARTLAPGEEASLRRVLLLLAQAGERGEALREYETFAERLRGELNVEVSTETQVLVQELRLSGTPTPAPAGASKHAMPSAESEGEKASVRAEEYAASVTRPNLALPREHKPPHQGRTSRHRLKSRVGVFGIEQADGMEINEQVAHATEPGTLRPPRSPQFLSKPRKPIHRGVFAAALAMVTLAGLGMSVWYRSESRSARAQAHHSASPAPAVDRSIAVLPFLNMSADPENEYFSDGITEDILTNLSKIQDLKVISRTSVMQYKNPQKPLKQIAQELGVAHVLEGSVRRAGDRVRISAKLTNAATDQHLWAETYDRELKDIFAVQDEIARSIVDALQVRLSSSDAGKLAKEQTKDPEAYTQYLKGRYAWNKRTKEGMNQAINYFQSAIERDPQYEEAYAGLADAYSMLGSYYDLPQEDAFARARAAVTRALELNPELPQAHASLGTILEVYEWDWAAAEREYKRAIELNPSYATARHWYADHLAGMGRLREALREIERARKLDPLSPMIQLDFGWILYLMGRSGEALKSLQETLALHPSFSRGYDELGLAYLEVGKHPEGIAALQRQVHLTGRQPDDVGLLAYAYARSGDRQKAFELLAELNSRSPKEPGVPAGLAFAYIGIGDGEKTFVWLEETVKARDYWPVFIGLTDPMFAPIRNDPRFAALRQRMGLPCCEIR